MMNIVSRFIRSLFCKHDYVFYDNIYGDEIMDCGWKRSKWVCQKCGKLQYRNDLVLDRNGEPYPSRLSIELMGELGYTYDNKENKFYVDSKR